MVFKSYWIICIMTLLQPKFPSPWSFLVNEQNVSLHMFYIFFRSHKKKHVESVSFLIKHDGDFYWTLYWFILSPHLIVRIHLLPGIWNVQRQCLIPYAWRWFIRGSSHWRRRDQKWFSYLKVLIYYKQSGTSIMLLRYRSSTYTSSIWFDFDRK